MPLQIDIVVFPGFDELDAIAPYEVLRNAAAAGADFSVRLVSLSGSPVEANHGLKVLVEAALDRRPDLLIVPGGGWLRSAGPGVRAEIARGELPARIAELHRSGTIIASVCTGAMLLAASGILHGRRATTHHQALEDLRRAGAIVVDARVVDDGEILSAGGVTSGLDLALWITERFASAKSARRVEQELEYERRGTVAPAE
jgi:transcriptional regulator GlxA family with amidase domain